MSMTTQGEMIERMADRIQERMGPVFGSPEYLADPVKLARAQKRQRESAEAWAQIAFEEVTTTLTGGGERGEGMNDESAITPVHDPVNPFEETEEELLRWHMSANVRWLAKEHFLNGYMPCGMLPGEFLKAVADRLDFLTRQLAAAQPPAKEG